MDLSAVVLTKNNQDTIRECLLSLQFADEIIIVDDFSTDKTLDIIEKFDLPLTFNIQFSDKRMPRIDVIQSELNNDFAAQRNRGLAKARGKWILFVDADEVVSQELAAEIKQTLAANIHYVYGYFLKRYDEFLGTRLHFGETNSVKLLRLAKRKKGEWHGSVHEEWRVLGKLGALTHPILHRRSISITDFLDRLNWYSSLQAQQFYQNKKKEAVLLIALKPLGKFIHNYVFRVGFLDGFVGFVFAWLMSWHSLSVRVKLALLWRNRGREVFKMLK